jgi:hypothetical protein
LPPAQGSQLGAGTGPINWDCDADRGGEHQSGASICTQYGADCTGVDINHDLVIEVLYGADDWDNLALDFQCAPSGNFNEGAPPP